MERGKREDEGRKEGKKEISTKEGTIPRISRKMKEGR